MKASTTVWMAKSKGGFLWTFTAARTRGECIRETMKNYREGDTWPQKYRQGIRVVRVKCKEI